MMRFAGMFLVLALSVVSAETYTLEIYQPLLLGGKQLKSGAYKLDVQGGNVTLKQGKLLAAELKVKVETLEQKARATRLICDKVGDNLQINAIELKGSTTKLVME